MKQAARSDPKLAADGAVLLLEKLAPAISQVDSSSGAIGAAVCRAIDTLVPIIASAPCTSLVRHRWLQRLWKAVQEDDVPYLEFLTDFWGELCASPVTASEWADAILLPVQDAWRPGAPRPRYLKETTVCLASLPMRPMRATAAFLFPEQMVLVSGSFPVATPSPTFPAAAAKLISSTPP